MTLVNQTFCFVSGRHLNEFRLPDAAQQVGGPNFQRSDAVPGVPVHLGGLQLARTRFNGPEILPEFEETDIRSGSGKGGAVHQQLPRFV